MIPVLVIAAVAYWLAAPDPVTAGARTAAGTGVKAAGTGVRSHWADGRSSRALTRTNRRDRWSKGGGFWRNLLRLEHAGVITAKGVKGAAGITRAAVRPVPAAAKAGWARGQERHRTKAGNRPVPVVLDPPWWRREQPQVQAGEQPVEQVQERPRGQVQGGNSSEEQGPDQWRTIVNKGRRGYEGHVLLLNQHPELPEQYVAKVTGRTPEKVRAAAEELIDAEQSAHGKGRPREIQWVDQDAELVFPPAVTHPSGIPPERRCEWCDDRFRQTKRGKVAGCSTCAEEIDGQIEAAKAAHPPTDPSDDIWRDPPVTGETVCEALGRYRDTPTDDRSGSRCRAKVERMVATSIVTGYSYGSNGDTAILDKGPMERRRVSCPNDATGPDGFCDDHRPGGGASSPLKTDPDPTDTTTDPTATPTPTEGDPVFTGIDTDLNDLTTVQDFARKVADMAEESDFAQLVEFCKNASDEVRDFGSDMAGDVAEFEEVAAKIGDLLSELVDAATKVKDRGAELVGG